MINAFKSAGIRLRAAALVLAVAMHASDALAGPQMYEPLSTSARHALQKAVSDQAVEASSFHSHEEARRWILAMSRRLQNKLPDSVARVELLRTVHYEATRAGLDPQLVLAVIQVESNFRKYAVSTAGARGYMQVMPFWVELIGQKEQNLFSLRTNLRYGCTILRHYLDIERGDLFRALGRYNCTLGKSRYPNAVLQAWRDRWDYPNPVFVRKAAAPARAASPATGKSTAVKEKSATVYLGDG